MRGKVINKIISLMMIALVIVNFSVVQVQAATLKLNYSNVTLKKDDAIVLKLSGTKSTSKTSGANSSVSVSKHYTTKTVTKTRKVKKLVTVTKTKKVNGKKKKVKVKQYKTVKEKYKTKVKVVVKNQFDVKGLKEGKATISVKVGKKTLKCNINVYETTLQKLNFKKEANTSVNLFGNTTKYIAHRGYITDNSPENSTASFIKAGQTSSFWGIETDVQKTKDGKFVVFHDNNLQRVTKYVKTDEEGNQYVSDETVTGSIRTKTFDELQSLCIKGHIDLKIPTYEEYLDICKKYNKVAVVELKNIDDTDIAAVINMIKDKGLINKSMIISNNRVLLNKVRAVNKTIPMTCLMSHVPSMEEWKDIYQMKNAGLNLKYSYMTQEVVDIAKSGNISIGTWYYANKSDMTEVERKNSQFITCDIPF